MTKECGRPARGGPGITETADRDRPARNAYRERATDALTTRGRS
ncbi:MAG: hypothetical protein JWN02_1416 [Acidobacteria bacterium]|nr:hypothetical protein [Acidobacteriota bacterium]